MQSAELFNEHGLRHFALVFRTGEDPIAGIRGFAARNGLTASRFTAIGAFERAMLGYFDYDRKSYKHIPVEEQVEVVSLTGTVARDVDTGEVTLHIHCVLGRLDGQARVGHLLEARVRPTLEVMLIEEPARLARRRDAHTGLALLDLGATEGGPGTAHRGTTRDLGVDAGERGGGVAGAENWWPGPGEGGGQP